MDDMDNIEKLVREYASKLAEHCDSVRIFITKHGDGSADDSISFSEGRGNFYSQIGQVKEWILMQDEYSKCKARTEWESEE